MRKTWRDQKSAMRSTKKNPKCQRVGRISKLDGTSDDTARFTCPVADVLPGFLCRRRESASRKSYGMDWQSPGFVHAKVTARSVGGAGPKGPLDVPFDVPEIVLVPGYWNTPYFIFLRSAQIRCWMVFRRTPGNLSLVPGEQVPDALCWRSRAIADPTRLKIIAAI